MATLARAAGSDFVVQSNSAADTDPINDTHTIDDYLVIADFQWYADSVDVDIRIGGDATKKIDALIESTENSGMALAGTYLCVGDIIVISLTGTTTKGYRLILVPWYQFYRGT